MSESKKSIDEQQAEAKAQFDARLSAEPKLETGERRRPKPEPKKPARSKPQAHRVGSIAHYHEREEEFEMVDEPCLYVEHNVRDRKGFTINGKRYRGRV